ncbi:MAG: peptidoglycan-associated lipoprotein Pal [Acidobacteria bacterium]|nr:peptidoglycan-associated lipoprotein Pal [Acidobacteriota bacterium]
MIRTNRAAWLSTLSIVALLSGACAGKPGPESPETQAPEFEPPAAVREAEEADTGWQQAEEIPEETAPRRAPEVEAMQGALQAIYFDFDRYNLKPEAIETLNQNLAWLRSNPDFEILIEGHCDERGTEEYNLALGDRRANSARAFLVQNGLAPGQLRTVSFGEEKPLDPRHSEAAWSKNRRAEFVIARKRSR